MSRYGIGKRRRGSHRQGRELPVPERHREDGNARDNEHERCPVAERCGSPCSIILCSRNGRLLRRVRTALLLAVVHKGSRPIREEKQRTGQQHNGAYTQCSGLCHCENKEKHRGKRSLAGHSHFQLLRAELGQREQPAGVESTPGNGSQEHSPYPKRRRLQLPSTPNQAEGQQHDEERR